MNNREFKVLKILSKHPARAKQIVEKTALPRSTVYSILKKLRDSNLIYYDKETQTYCITTEGKNALDLAENKATWRIHNVKVILRVIENKLNRPDLASLIENADKKADMKNWEAYYVDLRKYGIDATIQVNLSNDLSVIIHLPEFEAPAIDKAVLTIQNKIEQIRKALALYEGIPTYREWLDLNFDRALIRAEYAIPADTLEPGIKVNLQKPAKSLDGKELNEEAELHTDASKGHVELETNDKDTAETLEYLVKQAPQDIRETKTSLRETSEFIKDLKDVVKEMAEANKMLAENERSHIGYAMEMLEAGRYFKEGALEFKETLNTLVKVFIEDKKQQQQIIELLADQINSKKTNNGNRLSRFLPFFLLLFILIAGVKGGFV